MSRTTVIPGIHPDTPRLLQAYWRVSPDNPAGRGGAVIELVGVTVLFTATALASTPVIGGVGGFLVLVSGPVFWFFASVFARAVWPYRPIPHGQMHKRLWNDWTNLHPDDRPSIQPLYEKIILTNDATKTELALWDRYCSLAAARRKPDHIARAEAAIQRMSQTA